MRAVDRVLICRFAGAREQDGLHWRQPVYIPSIGTGVYSVLHFL